MNVKTVVAAVDSTAAAQPVLDTALGIGRLTAASVEAVHVTGHDGVETPSELASRRDIPLRFLSGPVVPGLLSAVAAREVIAAVLGARATPFGRRPVGSTALAVIRAADKPIVVVPPDVAGARAQPFHRLLVPLEGNDASSRAVLDGLVPLLADDVELIVLHVFTPDTVPRFLDRPSRDVSTLSREFVARHCPPAARAELRTGSVSGEVDVLCREVAADLIVLSWSQTGDPGRATVIRNVLGRATIPVLLLPTDTGDSVGEPLAADPVGVAVERKGADVSALSLR
jgi:nucleotide-binding universal stress UspA family protein